MPKYRKPVGPKLEKILAVVFGLFALLVVNSVYLTAVRVVEKVTRETYQNWFYIIMFLGHLVLGLLIIVPVIVFGIGHIRNSYNRPNKRAVRAGYALFATALVLLASGVILTRVEGVIVVKDPAVRSVAYWLHVLTPLVAAWLFVLHRLAGRNLKWRIGARWAVVAAVFAGAMVLLQTQDPRRWNQVGPESGETYFFPSLARTATGDFIPERVLMNDRYCLECHGDIHERWSNGVHRFSSFNNPPYLASVRETREVAEYRDGDVHAARFCAGCHDPVVFFSGKFDDPDFDDVHDPTGQAGITCTVCHSITHINSPRGNSDYTIDEPMHYPFAFSKNRTLAWTNRQLIKAKPDLHKKTFLKPLHKTPEFCGTCHKVHLPQELNKYKWLRGQNHYDAYHLSGVSGHGVTSFYYPPKAQDNCNGCHMPLRASNDFGARVRDDTGVLKIHDHLFPSANTGIPHLLDLPDWVNQAHADFNIGVMRVDLFGVRENGRERGIDGRLTAPLRPEIPALEPGQSYLLETVVRTLKMGHLFTQGTADSNEVWVDVRVTDGAGRPVGRSGGLGPGNAVDPWSHFINAFVLDREGRRIDRRNAQDIFVALYNNQIPPGAADVVHYLLDVPRGVTGPLTVDVKLRYRKFDTTYMQFVEKNEAYVNDLPILTLAEDRVVFPIVGQGGVAAGVDGSAPPPEPLWQRWNDFGIGLLRQKALRQAEEAFHQVEVLDRPDGPLNLARVYIQQGTVQDQAIEALSRAAAHDPPAPPWTVAWFTGLVNKQNGFLDEAIANFRSIIEADDAELRARGFDFSQDYRVLDELGETLFERASLERGDAQKTILEEAAAMYRRTLELDPEDVAAHFNLARILPRLDQQEEAAKHLALYQKYKPDDNARGRAINAAKARYPAASHAADAIVLYDLHRAAAYEADGNRLADTFALGPVESVPSQASLGGSQ